VHVERAHSDRARSASRRTTKLPFSSLIRDHPGRLKAAETITPECSRVLVKDAGRIRRQDPPGPQKHLRLQLPRSPCGKSGKGPEGFGRLGLCNDAFKNSGHTPQIDPVEDRSCVRWRLLESEQQEKSGRPYRPTCKQPVAGPL